MLLSDNLLSVISNQIFKKLHLKETMRPHGHRALAHAGEYKALTLVSTAPKPKRKNQKL